MASSLTPLSDSSQRSHLEEITTRWGLVGDARQFVMRYSRAIRSYIGAMVSDPHAAEDVCQDFLLNVLQRGFANASPDRGRFRQYLKTAVRNQVRMHFRRQRGNEFEAADLHEQMADDLPGPSDHEWDVSWKACLLDRAWTALHSHQRRSATTPYHTILKMAVDFPQETSDQLAVRVSAATGTQLKPATFRKLLSRARSQFARLLIEEVAQTLTAPTPQQVEDELADVDLLAQVRGALPSDWHTWPCFQR